MPIKYAFPVLVILTVVACGGAEKVNIDPIDPPSSGGKTGSGGRESNMGGEAPMGIGGSDSMMGGAPASGGSGDVEPKECGDLRCSSFASCEGAGDEATCVCAPGFEGDGQRCDDRNECLENDDTCSENSTCVNKVGSYYCDCDPGFTLFEGACIDINECNGDPCDEAANCENTSGGFLCTCDDGFFGDGLFCNEVDACAGEVCGEDGTCILVPGGFACQCPIGEAGGASCSACGETLELADPGLRVAVNLQLGRAWDDETPVLLSSLQDEYSLDGFGFAVQDLSGLECWSSLRYLQLESSEGLFSGAAVEALTQLTRLVDLNLDCTGLTDLDMLTAHPTLQSLSVSAVNCGVTLLDASALRSLPELEQLDLTGQALESFDFISGARSLRSLSVGQNKFSSLDSLPALPLLRYIYLGENGLTNLEGIGLLSSLEFVNITDNQLVDITEATQLPSLKGLSAIGNRIESIPDFSASSALNELSLSFNSVTSLSSIASLTQVTLVDLGGNQIDTLEPLLDRGYHGTLRVVGNPLSCETEEENFFDLRTQGIDLQGECIED